jgi:hypothetical protein
VVGGVADIVAGPSCSPSPSIGAALQLLSAPASKGGGERGETLFVGEVEPGGVAALGAQQVARQGDARMRRANRGDSAAASSTGSAISASTGTLASPMRLTKEELAPFSSRRRTR